MTMGDTGLEHSYLKTSKSPISKGGDAKSDARDAPKPIKDSDLTIVVKAWPQLPSAIRSAIVAIVRTSKE